MLADQPALCDATDFGLHGPYAGQMKAVLHQMVTSTSFIDLFADAPVGNPKHRPTYWRSMLHGFRRVPSFFASSIPASAERAEAESRWYVRPGNGLFELVQCRAGEIHSWSIDWKPEDLSSSFHGRDLFAPVAAMLARGEPPPGRPCQDGTHRRSDWPDDLFEIVYVDYFGNAMVGVRAAMLPSGARLAAAGRVLERARTFSNLPPGVAFWYENSNGLAEIAVNLGRADRDSGLTIGSPVEIIP